VSDHRQALARTTLLIDQEWFGGEADRDAIADALLSGTVRISADTESMSCRAGQAALLTAFMLIARMGIGIELDVPNVEVIDRVAPLRRERLRDALIDLGGDLVPGARVPTSTGDIDETFVFGHGEYNEDASPVYVWASDTDAVLERGGKPVSCMGELPFGGLAAGAACASLALEAVRTRIEEATGLSARTPRPVPEPPVHIRLGELFPGLADAAGMNLGRVDVVSGGAIIHALLFCLLRTPRVRAQVRVIELQNADLSNLNRYSLLRASHKGLDKVELLEGAASERIKIAGVRTLFTKETLDALPLAGRVLVGVDDVRARWWVQEANPRWLAVGATGDHLAQVTTHEPGSPCAACLHPAPVPLGEVPTISFVSFWAGLLQACALLAPSCPPRNIVVHPFALGGPLAIKCFEPVFNRQCPIRCSLRQSPAA
jgi:molybdopterin/thiamine biosynthesis adenylyltransferase